MTDTHQIEAVVIGAGVVGLACARALALKGREVVVLERHGAIGTETSSRNSEVIHAGIYYPQGSLKARLCGAGRAALYDFLETRKLPHRRLGKLIVASDAGEAQALDGIAGRARANGVVDLRALTGAEARALEPALRCAAALLSPSTGILDAHAFMLALRGELEDAGGAIAFNTEFARAERGADGFVIHAGGTRLKTKLLVNAAGLAAARVARAIKGLDAGHVPALHFARGNYFSCAARAPFSRLIYPAPSGDGGLGVHLTLDMGGAARFGPDVEWLAESGTPDYTVDAARGEAFYAAIRRYWPALPDGALAPAYSGIRPKLARGDSDFAMAGPEAHGVPGLVNLFGIESPGLTASLAIADEVVGMLEDF
ncbi:MAG: NAD(P)/FAD-dependent oxidoreductase [Parvibaculum sp.]|uniref:NAD(P)/FAD-dependent oxidoreductase n=1 Tax=Parvibaculum sp. TaxID=2024848 RepID=UPI002720E811|nr:NAD(P)/FAD-dependent oxidoreductase [Parvibaculum sp.]MDO8839765.1 NAD(P)/FAD-dependent oxidoreductase [Parvibaculum sp.]